jgi:hypothetical protein
MTRLAEAIRASANESARYRTDDGATVLVERVIGQFVPDSEEGYAVSVQRSDAHPVERFDADDLEEAMARLGTLDLPGFAPESERWQPADANVDEWTHSL